MNRLFEAPILSPRRLSRGSVPVPGTSPRANLNRLFEALSILAILFPESLFIKFQSVPLQQSSELVLKAHLLMMLLLPFDVSPHPFHSRLADRECGISCLPGKLGHAWQILMNPSAGSGFEVSEQI